MTRARVRDVDLAEPAVALDIDDPTMLEAAARLCAKTSA